MSHRTQKPPSAYGYHSLSVHERAIKGIRGAQKLCKTKLGIEPNVTQLILKAISSLEKELAGT